ncbi:peptidyl-prolyl cis-trans isomerase FKBP2-like [Apostichopus japonicus]|uniref:peptidyl-prolyl cis-trans isomerase FKBP2-like n=1 Tax=Stichopus japonicus TaxID=307972 RepID=UPI003AB91763
MIKILLGISLFLSCVLWAAEGGEIHKAEDDPRVTYEVLKESPRCKAKLKGGYQGHMDFIGRYQDTNEIFLNSTEYMKKVLNIDDENEMVNPVNFPMDMDFLLEGLRIGLTGQCNHEHRRIWVPKELVNGGRKVFSEEYIPRGRDLVFEVQMWNVVPNYMIGMPNMFKVYDTDKDGYLTKKEIGEYLVETDQYPSGPLITKLVNEFISKDDKDGDKRVSFEEFTGPKFDTDGSRHDEL